METFIGSDVTVWFSAISGVSVTVGQDCWLEQSSLLVVSAHGGDLVAVGHPGSSSHRCCPVPVCCVMLARLLLC